MEQIAGVLCVHGRADIVEFVRGCLALAGFHVKTARSMQEASSILKHASVDAQMLKKVSVRQIEMNQVQKPQEGEKATILIIDSKECMGKLYELGAEEKNAMTTSDSHWKSIPREATNTSQHQPVSLAQKSSIFNFGRLVIDVDAYEVRVAGMPIRLADREFMLLCLLAEHPRKVFTHEHLFREIWGEYGDRHMVSIYVGRIRKKIEVDPSRPHYIVTVWGVGYRFDGKRLF